jgi:hypothetical protein
MVAALSAVLCACPALAERTSDAQGRFEISWPADWAPGEDPAYVEAFSPLGKGINCQADSWDEPGVADMTQQQINELLLTPLSEVDWQALIGQDGGIGFIEGQVIDGSLVSQRATATYPTPDLRLLKLRYAVFVRPGEVFLGLCVAPLEDYPALAPLFESILDSFRPL